MGYAPSSLSDNFTDNSISTSAWVAIASGSATVAETGAQARFTLPSSVAGTHVARYTSRAAYDLTSDSFYINIETMVATGVAATAFFQCYLNGINTLQWIQVSGTLYARKIVAGTTTDKYSAAWSGTTYKYLRIRADTTTVYWDSSTNGTSWTNRASEAIATLFAVSDLFIDFGATCGNIASPGSFRLDDVNLILPALTTTWRWTQARRALVNRHKRTTIAIDTANTAQGYLISADGVDASDVPTGTVRYWSGPAGGGRLLTEQADEAAAQAAAVHLPLDGSFDLPQQIDARAFRLGHRSVDGSVYTLREFYPRRLVQSDDIEAESIRALHIAAGTITADKLDALLIIGNTISTAYNGARVTLSGAAFGGLIGYGATNTYNPLTGSGTYQVLWKLTDGKFYAGGGDVILDTDGIRLNGNNTTAATLKWNDPASATPDFATIVGSYTATKNTLILKVEAPDSGDPNDSEIRLDARNYVGSTRADMSLLGATQTLRLNAGLYVGVAGAPSVGIGSAEITGGLNVGTATGAGTGVVKATASDAGTTNAAQVIVLGHDSSGTPAANFGTSIAMNAKSATVADREIALIAARWATATDASRKGQFVLFVYDTAIRTAMIAEASGTAPMIGFLGAGAVTRRTVGAAAPAGGTGTAAGGYNTAANRDLMITLLNNLRQAGVDLGLWAT